MSLRNKTVSSIYWVGISTAYIKVINFIVSVILARLLSPSDFGQVAIALISINFFEIFRDLGIGTALIHKKDNINDAANTAFYIFPAVAVIFYFILYIFAPLIADFFNEEIEAIIKVLSLSMVIWSFGSLPRTLLSKELEFKKLTIVQTIPKIGYGVTSILLALEGYGVWSLVIGRLVLEVLSTFFVWRVTEWRPHIKFDFNEAAELLKYGKEVLVSSLLAFIIAVIDTTVIGKNLGAESLGYYTIGLSIASFFTIQLANVSSQVLFPVYSKINNNEKLSLAYLKSLKYLSYVLFPISFGIIGVSNYFIKIFYGDIWSPTIVVLQVLCIYGVSQSMRKISENIFLSTGKPKFAVKVNSLQLLIILVLIFPLTLKYGIVGTSFSVMLPSIIVLFVSLKMSAKALGIKYRQILNVILLPFFGSTIMLLNILVLQKILYIFSDIVAFAICVIAGMVIFVAFTSLTLKSEMKRISGSITKSISGRFAEITKNNKPD